ncbi:MAG: pyridoxine 5'-phosphate synthase [Burkholderiaceae bacterium]|nr:MAG: pyridoxine 5'-phosphate synthase [Burkholderiaceae bacterium]
MVELGVNIDHVATLREARKTFEPDPIWAAVEAHLGGADGITVHLREDRRHIQDADVKRLRTHTQIKLNLEMAPTEELLEFSLNITPEMVMFVPEGRNEITTEGGLNVIRHEKHLEQMIQKLLQRDIMVSVFIDADKEQIKAAKNIGVQVCEIHTGPYAHVFHSQGRDKSSSEVQTELGKIKDAGEEIQKFGMRFNAGHALNYFNVRHVAGIQGLSELHIGHAIISRSMFVGMREAVRDMKMLLREAK